MKTTGSDTRHAPKRGLVHNRDFMRFWVGETVSLFGVQVTTLALPLTAVVYLSATPEQVGALRMCAFLPFLFLAIPFGVIADRHPKRTLMIVANAVRAVFVGVVPVLALLDFLSVTALIAITLGIGVCTVLFEVCWSSYVPVIVEKDHLVTANGRVAASSSAAEFAGPGVGGLFVQLFTGPFALVANSASYLISVFTLWRIKTPEHIDKPAERNVRAEVRDGLRFVLRQHYLRILAISGAMFNFCYMFVEATFLIFAVRVLRFEPGLIGLVVALGAIGGLLGATIASPLLRRFRFGAVYGIAVLVGHCGPLLIPAAGGSPALQIVMVVAGFFLMRGGLSVFNVAGISLRQAVTPPHLMGRMTAGLRTISWGLGTLGALVGGFVAGGIGLRAALWVAAVGFLVAAVPMLLSRIPRLVTLPGPDPVDRELAPA